MKVRFNNEMDLIKEDYQAQIEELTNSIKNLSLSNKNLQDQNNRIQVMLSEYQTDKASRKAGNSPMHSMRDV
jgi:hypothetical protein